MLTLLALALATAPAAPPRLLVVSPEDELARAAAAALSREDAELTPRLEGEPPCGEVDCARAQALRVSAAYALLVRRTTSGATLRLVDVGEGFVVGAREVTAGDPTLLGAALGAEARALLRLATAARVADPAPPPPAPRAAPEPPVPPADPPPPRADNWGAVGVTVGIVLGVVAVGAAVCFGVQIATNGCANPIDDCANSCAGLIACGALAGACLQDAPAACDTATRACQTGVAACDTGLACLRACNGALLAPGDDEPQEIFGAPGEAEQLAMAY